MILSKNNLKLTVKVLILFFTVVMTVKIVNVALAGESFASLFQRYSGQVIATGTFFLFLNLFAYIVRFRAIMKTFGHRLRFSEVTHAALMGMIGGALLFQIVGQTVSRWHILKSNGVTAKEVLAATVYERVITAVSLFILAIFGFLQIYDVMKFDVVDLRVLQKSFLVLCVATVVVTSFVVKPYVKRILSSQRWSGHIRDVFKDLSLSLIVNATMGVTYVILIKGLVPTADFAHLFAGASLVMFIASVPVSLNGWGIRELSAVFIFQHVGVGQAAAVAASITLGVLSLVIMFLAGGVSFLIRPKSQAAVSEQVSIERLPVQSKEWQLSLLKSLPLLSALLIFFSVQIPLGKSRLVLNLADPIALGCCLLLFIWFLRRKTLPWDTLKPIVWTSGALVLVMGLGVANGFLQRGLSEWLLFNRGIGTIIIIGFLCTGYWAGRMKVAEVRDAIPRTVVWTLASIFAIDFFYVVASNLGFTYFTAAAAPYAFRGEAGNSNAFGFQLVGGLLCWLYLRETKGESIKQKLVNALPLILIVLGIWLSSSRTSWITSMVLLIAAYSLKAVDVRTIRIIAFTLLSGLLLKWGLSLTPAFKPMLSQLVFSQPLIRPYSEVERWNSIKTGLDIFLENPLLGAGIGANVERNLEVIGSPLVVHSTPVWMLSELGIAGFVLLLVIFVWLFVGFWRARNNSDSRPANLGLLLLITFAVFGLPHDIFFQRIFWFLLGFAIAGSNFKSTKSLFR